MFRQASKSGNSPFSRDLHELITVPNLASSAGVKDGPGVAKGPTNPLEAVALQGMDNYQSVMSQVKDIQAGNLSAFTLSEISLRPEEVYITYISNKGSSDERSWMISALTSLPKKEGIDHRILLSVYLTYLLDVLGVSNFSNLEAATSSMGVTLIPVHFDYLADVFQSKYGSEVGADSGTPDITERQYHALFCLYALSLIKRLTGDNYSAYFKNRIASLTTRLGLTAEESAWVADRVPAIGNCSIIRTRLGNSIEIRRLLMTYVRSSQNLRGDAVARQVSDVLSVLFAWVEMGHVSMILNYIITEAPSILTAPTLRTEALSFHRGMLTLHQLGRDAKYAKMLTRHEDLEDLQRNNIPLLASLAQDIAMRDYKTLSKYEPVKSPNFKEQVKELRIMYEKLTCISTILDKNLQRRNYDERGMSMIEAVINPNMLHLSTVGREAKNSFLAGLDDEARSASEL